MQLPYAEGADPSPIPNVGGNLRPVGRLLIGRKQIKRSNRDKIRNCEDIARNGTTRWNLASCSQ